MKHTQKIIICLMLMLGSQISVAAIKKCVDADGKVIFTDLACPGESQGQVLKGIDSSPSGNGSHRSAAPASSQSVSKHTQKIQELIDSARVECEAGVYDYLKSKHPAMHVEEIKHEGVMEKNIKGENSLIKFVSSAKYLDDIYSINQKVNCEATRTSVGGWKIEYTDQPYNTGIQFKPIGEL